jgi:hypothetical protein
MYCLHCLAQHFILVPRTKEGYYHYTGGVEVSAKAPEMCRVFR